MNEWEGGCSFKRRLFPSLPPTTISSREDEEVFESGMVVQTFRRSGVQGGDEPARLRWKLQFRGLNCKAATEIYIIIKQKRKYIYLCVCVCVFDNKIENNTIFNYQISKKMN